MTAFLCNPWGCGLVLFVATAWPLLLVDWVPYQDVPNHVASAFVLSHADRYPEYVSNGLVKTNAALFAWLLAAGPAIGWARAVKGFTVACLALQAWTLPFWVAKTGGRSSLSRVWMFLLPMVHHWFLCMGMLDFALAVPLSLATLWWVERFWERPSVLRWLAASALGMLTWYAHVFPLLVVHLFVLVRAWEGTLPSAVAPNSMRLPFGSMGWKPQTSLGGMVRAFVPLFPSTGFALVSLLGHFLEPRGPHRAFVTGTLRYVPPWELLYNAWAEWLHGFSVLELSSLGLAALLLGAWVHGVRANVRANVRASVFAQEQATGFFSPLSAGVLLFLYVVTPYAATNWFHVNSRFLPYLWLIVLVRAERVMPRWASRVGAALGCAYVLGLGVDYVRLDGDRARFVSGMAAVPEGAELLPLVFEPKGHSDNTRSLLHLWGLYVVERSVHVPLLFAHSRSFPLSHRAPPAPGFDELTLEAWPRRMGSRSAYCAQSHALATCDDAWKAEWQKFWEDALRRFDCVLTWRMPQAVAATLPPAYRKVYDDGSLAVFQRAP